MSNPTWPSTLPSPTDGQGSYAPLFDNIIKSQMEVGQKTRRRATYVPDVYTGSLLLTSAQVATLRTFIATTVKDVLPFDWKDFRTGATQTYAFHARPTYTKVKDAKDYWNASIELVTLP